MRRSGFTLVELIISLSLMAVLMGGMFFAFGQGWRAWKKVVQNCERHQVEGLVAERIAREARAASEVLAGSGSAEVMLRVGPEIISYKLVEGKVRRKKGASSAYLTCEGEIQSLSFSYPSVDMIRIVLNRQSFCVSARN